MKRFFPSSSHQMKYESHLFTISTPQSQPEIKRRHGVKRLPYVINIQKHIKLFFVCAETKHITLDSISGGEQQYYNFVIRITRRMRMFNSCFPLLSFAPSLLCHSRYFYTFHSNCYQNKSLLRLFILMLLMNLIILLQRSFLLGTFLLLCFEALGIIYI